MAKTKRSTAQSDRETAVVYVRLPHRVLALANQRAEEEERDRSAIVRRAIEAYCAKPVAA